MAVAELAVEAGSVEVDVAHAMVRNPVQCGRNAHRWRQAGCR